MGRKIFFSQGNLTAAVETGMSRKRGTWAVRGPLSAVLDLCKRVADRCRWFAGRIADQLRMAGRENQLEAVRVVNVNHPLHVDFAGKPVELLEFVKGLGIGDRIRVFCDDGVVVAEKISQTQFKEIHAETMAELIH
jgi:hypothetical protein